MSLRREDEHGLDWVSFTMVKWMEQMRSTYENEIQISRSEQECCPYRRNSLLRKRKRDRRNGESGQGGKEKTAGRTKIGIEVVECVGELGRGERQDIDDEEHEGQKHGKGMSDTSEDSVLKRQRRDHTCGGQAGLLRWTRSEARGYPSVRRCRLSGMYEGQKGGDAEKYEADGQEGAEEGAIGMVGGQVDHFLSGTDDLCSLLFLFF